MLRDVFYYGSKPNVHPREKFAKDINDARKQCVTEHFWVINEFCDYRNFDWDFDFEYLSDDEVWTQDHNNVWPSTHQKDSGTWLCPKEHSDLIVYRNDVDPIKRKNIITSNWKLLENIDTTKWDFSWHPDPTEPPYIYKWGSKYAPVEYKSCLEYHVPGATSIKYMTTIVELLPNWDLIKEYQKVDQSRWDMSWRPSPLDPPFIYVWGNKFVDGKMKPTLEYHVPGATEKKYMLEQIPVLPEWDRWHILHDIDKTSFDFSWRPDPREPDFIYVFGNEQHSGTVMPTVEYHTPHATIRKYISDIKVKLLSNPAKFEHLENSTGIDYSWVPDPTAPPYIYAWGNQWNKPEDKISIQYVVDGATEYKYMSERAIRKPCLDNWLIPDNIDTTGFDFSWEPSPADPAYIYEFGTQHQKTGGPQYIVEGATEKKYIDIQKVKALPTKEKWIIPNNIDVTEFDFSWHPDSTDPAYIYQFGTQWALSGGPRYVVEGATTLKYMDNLVAKALPNKEHWIIPPHINADTFDFSWHPYAEDEPFIYQFGTQHQKTGGPKYIAPGTIINSPVSYIDRRILKAERLPSKKNFAILNNYKIKDFDYSWHPDDTEEPYIYVFGNNQYPAEIMPTIEYVVPGAKQIKYVTDIVATLDIDKTNWVITQPIDEAKFDFSWKPNPMDPPYIYRWGNKYISGKYKPTIDYVVPDATEIKYMSDDVEILPEWDRWIEHIPVDKEKMVKEGFDFSWRPDPLEPDYNYIWGNPYEPAEIKPTLEYRMPNATEVKYTGKVVPVLPQMEFWQIPKNIDTTDFDFSWRPDPLEPDFIWEFGTQWQKTGGPRYVVPGAVAIKYISTQKAKALSTSRHWEVPDGLDISEFDFSWHPDNIDKPYIYQFGTQWALSGGPRYVVPNAKEVKYIEHPTAKAAPNKTNWIIPDDIDSNTFDFSWHPYAEDDPYIYQFGTQHQKTGGPRYIAPGADESSFTKYIDTRILKATKLPNKTNFKVLGDYKIKDFDYSWHPDDTEQPYIYVFGTTLYPAEIMPVLEYRLPNATQTKYINTVAATLDSDMTNWEVPSEIDVADFDFGWRPNPNDPPYIYEFGTQWQKTGGPRYVVPGASEIKYVDTIKAKRKPNNKGFVTLNNFVIEEFDYSWHPDSTEEPYIYVFGNQWNDGVLEPTIEYRVEGATQIKYINDPVAKVGHSRDNFEILEEIESFDFSWRPDPTDPPYIYVFGNTQYPGTIMPTVKYKVEGATQEKFIEDVKAKLVQKPELFKKKKNIKDFDYSWRPDPNSPPYVYVFGNQWYSAEKDSTIEYHEENAIAKKYINDVKAIVGPNMDNWEIPKGCNVKNFDFSWYPDPGAPKYIYQFGTLIDPTDGPRYITPGNDGTIVNLERVETEGQEEDINVEKYVINTTLDALIAEHPNEIFWALNPQIDYTNFDFEWRPNIEQAQYVHAFGSPDSVATQTYLVNAPMWLKGNRDINFVENKKLDDESLFELFKKPDMFFVDRGNKEANERLSLLKKQFPNIQKTRYLNSWVDTINRCINRSTNDLCWILDSELDYSNFNFKYYPNPWQMTMVHVFGTQYSHWGTTFMVNRNTFANDTKYIKIIEHLSNLNFVKDRRATATNCLYDIVLVDHGNKETETIENLIKEKIPYRNITVVKFNDSYLKTLQQHVKNLPDKKDHYLWVVSSVCDYSQFDFNYICDPFAKDQLHVFPSQNQKFGDTFLLDVNKTKSIIDNMESLEEYTKVNYNNHQRVPRLPAPVVVTGDTHVDIVNHEFDFPYCIAVTKDNQNITAVDPEPISLWSVEKRNVLVTSNGGTRIIVPKDVKNYFKEQLYDYPYIKTNSKLVDSNPLDIVFLSNGESCADSNYEHLLKMTHGLPNRVVRVDGVNGRVQAYHAALEASNTPWAFTVFAKLKVNAKFDWNWQPDRLQQPKHYIFHAKNPVNSLEYGHQGMIAYNKELTLKNKGFGLDFTLDDPHETVEILSGTATYNTDEFSTWRTAFREVIKLRVDDSKLAKARLKMWLSDGKGDFCEYSKQGAEDALAYYDEVKGDPDKLKLSYEWKWLKQKFKNINKKK